MVATLVCLGLVGPLWAGEYSRKSFQHSGWRVIDHMTLRHIILKSRSLSPAIVREANTRQVVLGSWRDGISGRIWRDVNPHGLLEIDHVIPLKWAWEHGARAWTYEKRNRFSNDPAFLIITSKSANASKQALGADMFLPTDPVLACDYIIKFEAGALKYHLDLSVHEWTLIATHEKSACRDGPPSS